MLSSVLAAAAAVTMVTWPLHSSWARTQHRAVNAAVTSASVQHTRFPWMGALISGPTDDVALSCGASLIAPQWALGAAHCHPGGTDPGTYAIRFDSSQWSTGGIVVPVQAFHDQPGTDLTLIELAAPITTISPVAYATNINDPAYKDGARAVSMGWGTSNESQTTPSRTLRWVIEQIYPSTTCGLTSADSGTYCAGAPGDVGSALCQHDSGAPYVYSPLGFTATGSPLGPVEVTGTLRGLTNETCGRAGVNDDFQQTAPSAAWIASTIAQAPSAEG